MKVRVSVLLCAGLFASSACARPGADGPSTRQRRFPHRRDLAAAHVAAPEASTPSAPSPASPLSLPAIPTALTAAQDVSTAAQDLSRPPSPGSALDEPRTTNSLFQPTASSAPSMSSQDLSDSNGLLSSSDSQAESSSPHPAQYITASGSHLDPTQPPYALSTTEARPTRTGDHAVLFCQSGSHQCITIGKPNSPANPPCTPLPFIWQPRTVYSIVYTSTITFSGNRSHYTPPYQTISTPHICAEQPSFPTLGSYWTHTDDSWNIHPVQHTTNAHPPLASMISPPVVTFITTDKNPMVVYVSSQPPSPTDGLGDPYPEPITHEPAGSEATTSTGANDREADRWQPPVFHVTAMENQVIINGQTFTDGPGATAVVAVDGGHFTIYPTAVVGEGKVITKPPPPPKALGVPMPTSGEVGDLNVTLSGTELVVGGVAMTIPPYRTTAVVDGKSVTVAPYMVAIGPSVFPFNLTEPPPENNIVIDGGEVLTAIGKNMVVLNQTTMTYGAGVAPVTKVIDDDTIVIGPSGVLVHGLLLGGPTAQDNDTQHDIVGGATVTRAPPDLVIINGKTFTIGPQLHPMTTEIAGKTFTIGPAGVAVSTMNITLPFGPAVTATIIPTGTWLSDFPRETDPGSGDDDDKDSSSSSLQRGKSPGHTAAVLCIAIGVLFLA